MMHKKKRIVKFLKTMIACFLSLCLVVENPLSAMEGMMAQEEPVRYLEDVRIFMAPSGSEDDARNECRAAGYTLVNTDLNMGTDTERYVFMGYKTTTDPKKAIRKMGLLAMDHGYEIKDYKELKEKYEKSNYAAADAFQAATEEFIDYYEKGSPMALQAYEGLNMINVPEAGNMKLGDYLVQGKSNRDFFAKVIVTSCSGIVSVIINYLSAGMTPYKNEYDDDEDEEVTINWAERLCENELWESIDNWDYLSEEEQEELNKRYQDTASLIFAQLQNFANEYNKAEAEYNEDKLVAEVNQMAGSDEKDIVFKGQNPSDVASDSDSVKISDEVPKDVENVEEAVEESDSIQENDISATFVMSYNKLNEYKANEEMPLGEWMLNIGEKTSESVDLKQLYPLIASLSEAECSMIKIAGITTVVSHIGENKHNDVAEELTSKAKENLMKLMNEDSFSIWTNADPDIMNQKVAFTSDAIRENSSSATIDYEEPETTAQKFEEFLKWAGIASAALTVVVILTSKLVIAGLVTAIGCLFVKLGLVGAAMSAASVASAMISFSSVLGTYIAGPLGIALLIVTVFYYIGKLVDYLIHRNDPKEYSEIPDAVVDVVETARGSIQAKYDIIKTNSTYSERSEGPYKGKDKGKADLNAYMGQSGWICMFASKDERIGSPIVEDKNGQMFHVAYGDASHHKGFESVNFFGEISPGNCNQFAKKDGVNGIYIYYHTVDSLKEGTGIINNTTINTSTNNATTEPKKYYSDIIVKSADTPAKAKAKITVGGFYVWDQELSPHVKDRDYSFRDAFSKGMDRNQYTYIGYKVTTDPNKAIRDIRVGTFTGKSAVSFGEISYGCSGTLGYPADDASEDSSYPADLDGLYITKSKKAGTPIEVGRLHLLSSFNQVQPGWEPVTTFSGLPYNFDTSRYDNAIINSKYETGHGGTPGYRYYRSIYTGTILNDDESWSDWGERYLYYEPAEKFTSGTKYLSGIYFSFGADAESEFNTYNEPESPYTDLLNHMKTIPNSKMYDLNLASSYFYVGGAADGDQKHLNIGYTWSYNPYRAIYNVAALRGSLYYKSLPYNMQKALSYPSGKYAAAADHSVSYTAATMVTQRVHADNLAIRGIGPENAYMSINGLWGSSDEPAKGYITDLPGDYPYGFKQMPFLATGLYVSGYVDGQEPLTLDDVVISSSSHQGQILEGKIVANMNGETTLGGSTPSGQFASIQDMNRPYETKPFNIAYPKYVDPRDNSHNASSPFYIYTNRTPVKKKYISRIFVGACSWDDAGTDDEDTLEEFSKQVDYQALITASSQASDEVIPVNICGSQSTAWYNRIENKDDEDDDDYVPRAEVKPEEETDRPAAYISVARTDKEGDAIKGILLFESNKKVVPEVIKVEGMDYYCASNSTPVKANSSTKYFLYYTYNAGAIPGKPITSLSASEEVFVSGEATALSVNKTDSKSGQAEMYGNTSIDTFIHAAYEHDRKQYFSKLRLGKGNNRKAALLKLLEKGCTEFCDIDLNSNVGGDAVYFGYRGLNLNQSKIDEKNTKAAKDAEKENQLKDAIYDVVCTVDEPYHSDGIITEKYQIYYTPVGNVDLNSGTNGPPIYMYYTTKFAVDNYNKRQGKDTRRILSSNPGDYFSSRITSFAFACCDRVPYNDAQGASSAVNNKYPWEYVMQCDNDMPAELNDGAIKFDDDHFTVDNRIYMFAQREDGKVKKSAEITGGYTRSTNELADLWCSKD
ncbi:hypothetical protein [Eubacterium xylanophilum]|uniref:hypothetical protein n=1 Tax=Eubacterium xylanophilum TaxID=39497 RepID=UPI00047ABF75|nr:hypothetical protein [Eubacterium xylanophilum]